MRIEYVTTSDEIGLRAARKIVENLNLDKDGWEGTNYIHIVVTEAIEEALRLSGFKEKDDD